MDSLAMELFDARKNVTPLPEINFNFHDTPYHEQPPKQVLTVEEIQSILGIGRSAAYELVKNAPFKVIRIGSTLRISKKSFEDWLN